MKPNQRRKLATSPAAAKSQGPKAGTPAPVISSSSTRGVTMLDQVVNRWHLEQASFALLGIGEKDLVAMVTGLSDTKCLQLAAGLEEYAARVRFYIARARQWAAQEVVGN